MRPGISAVPFLAAHLHMRAACQKGSPTAARMSSTTSLASATSGPLMPVIVPRRR